MSRIRLSDGTCAICGVKTDGLGTYGSYCSRSCQTVSYRYPEGRPNSRPCVKCGETIDFNQIRPGGRKLRSNTRKCFSCRRDARYPLTREQLAERDGSTCSICMGRVDFSLAWPNPRSPSVDHVIPWTKGGTNEPENLALAHLSCNVRKQNKVSA